jgi:hypothetical protein
MEERLHVLTSRWASAVTENKVRLMIVKTIVFGWF